MTKRKPKILITNDDGINAPGIRYLWEALCPFADTYIVAPLNEQSGAGLSLTLKDPIHIHEIPHFEKSPAWAVSGTPADCVKMALRVILETPPDLIVSGINRGCNAGGNLLYSGTVGGVIEGAMQKLPGIAFSCRDYLDPDYASVTQHIPKIVKHVLNHPLPEGTLLNVNFPFKKDLATTSGIRLARQGRSFWGEAPEKRTHPLGSHHYYWLGLAAKEKAFDEHDDSDISLLKKGFITAVPISIRELTDLQHFSDHQKLFDGNVN